MFWGYSISNGSQWSSCMGRLNVLTLGAINFTRAPFFFHLSTPVSSFLCP